MKGKDRGKQGKITEVITKQNKALVKGLNMFKKHQRPKKQGEKGELVSVSRPIAISNLMLVCPSCNKPTRIGYRNDGDKKLRYCKKCKSIIEK